MRQLSQGWVWVLIGIIYGDREHWKEQFEERKEKQSVKFRPMDMRCLLVIQVERTVQ